MFQRNDALLAQYYANHPQSKETLIDFGQVPVSLLDRQDWEAEASNIIRILANRNFLLQPAMYDGASGLCPLYTVRLGDGDFQRTNPVERPYFQWVVSQICHPWQKTSIHERVLEIHVLGDDPF